MDKSLQKITIDNIVMWVIQLNIVDWVCFKTQTLLETLKILNQHLVESYVSLEVEHLFQQVGCARSKRQCLTVPPQNRKIIALDAGLRMDGIPALDLWDVVVEVLHSSNHKKSSTQEALGNRSGFKEAAGNSLHMPNTKLKKKGDQIVDQLSNLHHVATNATQLLLNVKRRCTILKTTRQ